MRSCSVSVAAPIVAKTERCYEGSSGLLGSYLKRLKMACMFSGTCFVNGDLKFEFVTFRF